MAVRVDRHGVALLQPHGPAVDIDEFQDAVALCQLDPEVRSIVVSSQLIAALSAGQSTTRR